jgi:hypothetical protein
MLSISPSVLSLAHWFTASTADGSRKSTSIACPVGIPKGLGKFLFQRYLDIHEDRVGYFSGL